jgi:hypothetical protein
MNFVPTNFKPGIQGSHLKIQPSDHLLFASICQFYYCSINSLGIFSKFDPLLVEMSISGADWVPLEEPSPRPRMLYTGWRALKP